MKEIQGLAVIKAMVGQKQVLARWDLDAIDPTGVVVSSHF
jgi:hypothetical protein